MTGQADIIALGAEHLWDFDGDALDGIGAVDGTNSGCIFTNTAISLDATNCMTTDGLTDSVTLATTTDINNSSQGRKAFGGWYRTTAFQAPPSVIYGEGDELTNFQMVFGFGNNVMFEVTEPVNFATGLQVYGPALVPGRSYHLLAIYLSSGFGNEVKFFVDGIEMFDASPTDRAPDTGGLDARAAGGFGDPAGTVGIGGGVVIQQAARNGRYNMWASWDDTANAELTDTDIRVTLFEKQAIASSTVTTATVGTMQTSLDGLTTAQVDRPCCIDIQPVTGGGDFTLTSDKTFDPLASIHYRYNGSADTLTIVNTGAGAATIGSAPYGGNIVIANRQTLTITVLDNNTGAVVVGARVYIQADTGGDLTPGTVIMNTVTNGSGVATATFDFTNDQPIIGRIRQGSTPPLYKTNSIAGPLTANPLDATILMLPDS
jgi:hypothetical protein